MIIFQGDNPLILWTVGINLLSASIYWLGAIFYLILDLIDKPKWIAKYKIQPGVNEPVDISAIIKVTLNFIFAIKNGFLLNHHRWWFFMCYVNLHINDVCFLSVIDRKSRVIQPVCSRNRDFLYGLSISSSTWCRWHNTRHSDI